MDIEHIQHLDEKDPLKEMRSAFCFPKNKEGIPLRYFCGHSLGLQPKIAENEISSILNQWKDKAVEQWFEPEAPWYPYFDQLREPLGKIVGARASEVTVMNSLTVNMHLLLATFYQPTANRYKIVVDSPVFPSDLFALKSQIQFHGYDPDDALVLLKPKDEESTLTEAAIDQCLKEHGASTALVWFSGVNYFTGQHYALQTLVKSAQAYGCCIGLDLAHAIGNVPLELHNWGVDFAVWCHYKYLNSGPGSVGGAFVHEKHWSHAVTHRLEGWWGCHPERRFDMQESKGFAPDTGANAWQLSTPSLLSAAPLRASLKLFEKTQMSELREKSIKLTGLLEMLLEPIADNKAKIITPNNPNERGAQLSLILQSKPTQCLHYLKERGFVCYFRKPNVLRAAPAPMYNTYSDVYALGKALVDFFR